MDVTDDEHEASIVIDRPPEKLGPRHTHPVGTHRCAHPRERGGASTHRNFQMLPMSSLSSVKQAFTALASRAVTASKYACATSSIAIASSVGRLDGEVHRRGSGVGDL